MLQKIIFLSIILNNMFKNTFVYCFLALWGISCNSPQSYFFDEVVSIKVDEKNFVWTQFPTRVISVDSDRIATLNSSQVIAIYDLKTGNNLDFFDISKQNFDKDSLIINTYAKKFEKKAIYKTIEDDNVEPFGKKTQIKAFSYSDKKFYIQFSVLCDILHQEDSACQQIINENEQLKSLMEKYGSIKLVESNFLDFLCITNEHFQVLNIAPLYYSNFLEEEGISPAYNKYFLWNENKLKFAVSKSSYQEVSKDRNYKISLATGDIFNTENIVIPENNLNLDYSDFGVQKIYSSPLLFSRIGDKNYCSNSKEVINVSDQDKLLIKDDLEKNEWIEAFSMIDNNTIVMLNTFNTSKKHPTDFEKNYEIDSTINKQIKIIDRSSKKILLKDNLLPSSYSPIITESKIIYFSKDAEGYYINLINYGKK